MKSERGPPASLAPAGPQETRGPFVVTAAIRNLLRGLVVLSFIARAEESGTRRIVAAEETPAKATPEPRAAVSAAATSRTIGHQLLELEAPLGTVRPEMSRLLDDLAEEVRRSIGTRPPEGDPDGEWNFALRSLRRIDEVLSRRNFVYSTREDLAASLSDALTPRRLDPQLFRRIVADPSNARRRAQISRQPDGLFHTADCDTVSFIYLSIGEALDLPISLVEVPHHNFVRWSLTGRSFVNWETVHGVARSNQDFIRDYRIPQAAIQNGTFLAQMTPENVLGYGRCIVAAGLEKQGRHREAQAEYRLAITANGRSPMPWNNLAWSLTTSPDPELRNGREAVEFAKKGVEIYRTANSLDTLACAYAEAGDFQKAISTAIEASALDPANSDLKRHIASFQRRQTWIELHASNATLPKSDSP